MGRGYAPKESDDTTETPGGVKEAHGKWPEGRGEPGASEAKVVTPRAIAPPLRQLYIHHFMNPSKTINATSTKPKNKSSLWAKAGIQKIKRARADAFIGANPNFSDRQLARLAGESQTIIAMRRKVNWKS
jgi:hypothetical protein